MSRLAIFSHSPSDTVNLIRDNMTENDQRMIKIRSTGSLFRGRSGDLIVNYGSSSMPEQIIGNARVLNHPSNISNASNKRTAMNILREAGVSIVESTSNHEEAQGWLDQGCVVYARTTLQGHSGSGIVVCANQSVLDNLQDIGSSVETQSTLASAQLYTKGLLEQRREFRIHVMGGVVTYVQQKRRRDGYREMEEYSNVVRNYHTGWIYATQNANVIDQAKDAAIASVSALGLDYGAVDVITRQDNCWVLEVNTAPGMTGTNLETFCSNIRRLFNDEEVVGTSSDMEELIEEIREELEITPQNLPLTRENWRGKFVRVTSPSRGSSLVTSNNNIGIVVNVIGETLEVVFNKYGPNNSARGCQSLRVEFSQIESFVEPRQLEQTPTSIVGFATGTLFDYQDHTFLIHGSNNNSNILYLNISGGSNTNSREITLQDMSNPRDSGVTNLTTMSVGNSITVDVELDREGMAPLGISDEMQEWSRDFTECTVVNFRNNEVIHIVRCGTRTSSQYVFSVPTATLITTERLSTLRFEAGRREEIIRERLAEAEAYRERIRQEEEQARQLQIQENQRLSSTLIDDGIYIITVDGSNTVGVFRQEFAHFEIVAWEIPVEVSNCTIGAHLGNLQTN